MTPTPSSNRFAILAAADSPPPQQASPKKRRPKSTIATTSGLVEATALEGSVNAVTGALLNGQSGVSAMLHRTSKKPNAGGGDGGMVMADEEVLEMGGEEKARLSRRVHGEESEKLATTQNAGVDKDKKQTVGLSAKDKRAMVLLIVLYLLQGIPVGLAFGSVPFLLRARLSYSQIAIFSLASYPYSLKLLWSPIVDSWYSPSIGRRKSWIMPVQAIVGIMLWWLGTHVDTLLTTTTESGSSSVPDVKRLTVLFFILVLFAATQDIAVDGWALELLSKDNLSYASTAQTVGLNIGYFLSFTVFLAFNSVEFSNNRFRPLFGLPVSTDPILTLSSYLKFSGFCFVVVTVYLFLFHIESPTQANFDEDEMDVGKVYKIMIQIVKLPHVQTFIVLHMVAKLGTSTNDAVTSLKLLERGLSKEDLALAVLVDFPFQIFFGYLAAKWSSGDRPLRPWIAAMWFRLAFAAWGMALVHYFPQTSTLPTHYFILVIASTVMSSFAQTIQFVGISAFHTQIADPLIGGTYMTLLNTVSNLGGTWPKYFVLKGVDYFTIATCQAKSTKSNITESSECVSDQGKTMCSDAGGICKVESDGYYTMQMSCLSIGAILLFFVITPRALRLQALPASAWQVKRNKTSL